ncbi:MAG: hypothetical protein AB1489_40510 [Acidobacteriota bacterium]
MKPDGVLQDNDEDNILRLIGYGFCQTDNLIWSTTNHVRLVAMDEVEEDKLHIYRVPLPNTFYSLRGKRGITVSLAFDPPVRARRREYLARTMWFEVLQGLTTDQVQEYRSRFTGEESPQLPSWADVGLRPTRTRVQYSTLQVRRKIWTRSTSPRIAEGDNIPAFHLLVGCQRRFPTGLPPKQKYGIVVHLWHEGVEIELYQSLKANIRVRPTRIRV